MVLTSNQEIIECLSERVAWNEARVGDMSHVVDEAEAFVQNCEAVERDIEQICNANTQVTFSGR